jgi:hypothetical protein
VSTQVVARPVQQPRHDPPGTDLPPFRKVPVISIAVAFTVLEIAVSARYGFHRDELYFLECAHHLAWGYVDQPPMVPAIAWLSTHLWGTSPESIRLLSALAGGAAVVLTGLMARELGGGWRAQVLAALAAATSSQTLAAFHLLSTTPFDAFFWCATTYVAVRLLRTGDRRLWLALGLVVGVGLLNKWNIGFLAVSLGVGFLTSGRRDLRDPWPWAGAAVALVIWLPNLVWNAQHQWAEVAMSQSLHAENGGLGAALGFIPSQLVVVGPALVVFWLAGLRHLLRTERWRPLGVAYVFLVLVFAVIGGKSYYLAGMYYVLFAAGGVWAEARLLRKAPPRGVRGWVALMIAGCVVGLPLTLPVLPAGALPKSSWEGSINKDLSATVGWHHFVGQVAGVARTLPPGERTRLVIFTGDYGAAGAVDLWGAQYGLPQAISGHNSYWWWGPAGAHDGATTIAVNLSRSYLLTIFSTVTSAGSVSTPGGEWTEERGDPIWICQNQRVSWARAWPAARHYG